MVKPQYLLIRPDDHRQFFKCLDTAKSYALDFNSTRTVIYEVVSVHIRETRTEVNWRQQDL